ncbi:MAG: cupin domain-containing protein [Acidimicrobiales bacterium]
MAEKIVVVTPTTNRKSGTTGFIEYVRLEEISIGEYVLPAGAVDDQMPHSEAEVYVVTAGKGQFEFDGHSVPVSPGTTLFVPAGAVHRFVEIEEDLVLTVVFAPAYSGRRKCHHVR